MCFGLVLVLSFFFHALFHVFFVKLFLSGFRLAYLFTLPTHLFFFFFVYVFVCDFNFCFIYYVYFFPTLFGYILA